MKVRYRQDFYIEELENVSRIIFSTDRKCIISSKEEPHFLTLGTDRVVDIVLESQDNGNDELAKTIKELTEKNDKLSLKNKQLETRLSRVVELPCGVGDTIYVVDGTVVAYEVTNLAMRQDNNLSTATFYLKERRGRKLDYFFLGEINMDKYFTTREKAEKRLFELQEVGE